MILSQISVLSGQRMLEELVVDDVSAATTETTQMSTASSDHVSDVLW